MTIRDILVHIDETPSAAVRAEIAAALADRHQSRLTGVFLRSAFRRNLWISEATLYAAAMDIDAMVRDHARTVDAAAEEARIRFEALAADACVVSDWLVIDGDTDAALIDEARRHDLTVLPVRARPLLSENQIFAAQIGLASGGPILVIAEDKHPRIPGRRVIVAWKNSRESARALRDAWPLLAAAEEVHVITVAQHGKIGPDSELQRHFERHGVKAKIIVATDKDFPPSQVLRQEAANLNADLIVMGLYGRPRFGELVLGGVTVELLDDPPVALFLSH